MNYIPAINQIAIARARNSFHASKVEINFASAYRHVRIYVNDTRKVYRYPRIIRQCLLRIENQDSRRWRTRPPVEMITRTTQI